MPRYRTPLRMMRREEMILTALKEKGPMTTKQIGEAVFIEESTAYRYTKQMHEEGKIYVFDWNRELTISAIYAIGPGKDKKKIKRLSEAEYTRRRKQRLIEKLGEEGYKELQKHLNRKYRPAKKMPSTLLPSRINVLAG